VLLGLGISGQLARRLGLPPIPLYLLARLVDLVLNLAPGLAAGLLLGWGPLAAITLGGITYISSSGVIAKLLGDLGRLANRETPVVLSILVIEDLAMAAYLPVVTVLLAGGGLVPTTLALAAVAAVLTAALRYGASPQTRPKTPDLRGPRRTTTANVDGQPTVPRSAGGAVRSGCWPMITSPEWPRSLAHSSRQRCSPADRNKPDPLCADPSHGYIPPRPGS
jgi:hypothetical protein